MDRKIVIEPQPIQHPQWCQPARCTATPAGAIGEAHRGEPVTITVGGIDTFVVTACLLQPHAPWLTEVFVELDVSGLIDNGTPVRGMATVPAHRAAEVGQALFGLAAWGLTEQRREIAECVATRLRMVAA